MSTQWANIGDDAGALHALLQRVTEYVSVDLVDDVWIFPPRKTAAGESIVIVVGARGETDDRRRVITAHFTVVRNRKGVPTVTVRFDEHGTAPSAAVLRIVQGVLRRLGEDTEASPREEVVAGSRERWDQLILDLGGRPTPPDHAAETDAAATDHRAEPGPADEPHGAAGPEPTEAAGHAAGNPSASAARD